MRRPALEPIYAQIRGTLFAYYCRMNDQNPSRFRPLSSVSSEVLAVLTCGLSFLIVCLMARLL